MIKSTESMTTEAPKAPTGGPDKFLKRLLTRKHRPDSTADLTVKRFKVNEGCEKNSVGSRQRLRATARKARLEEINTQFGKESRAARRGLALKPFKVKSWKKGSRAGRHQ